MAKGGKRKTFFDKNIEMFGERFLDRITSRDIQRGAVSIFRDIAYGNLEVEKYINYFSDARLTENLLVVATQNLMIHSVHAQAINIAYNVDPNFRISAEVNSIYVNDKKSLDAYATIKCALENFKVSGNAGYLTALRNTLGNFRYNI